MNNPDYQLTPAEFEDFKDKIQHGLSGMDGDTAPMTITVRQLSLLVENYKLNV